jgi:hypothetical protein
MDATPAWAAAKEPDRPLIHLSAVSGQIFNSIWHLLSAGDFSGKLGPGML